MVLGVLIGCGCGRLLCAKKPAAKEKRGYRSMSMEEAQATKPSTMASAPSSALASTSA